MFNRDFRSTVTPRLSQIRGLLARSGPAGSGFESSRYLAKWLVLGTIIGIVAGLAALTFTLAIELATKFFLGDLVGFLPPSPIGEGEPILHSMDRPWALPLVVALGGLISGIIVWKFAPEAEGHGTDAAISAIHFRGGRLRGRVPPIKLISSALTIGSGGSGGREGPTAQISAGIGSLLGQWLNLSTADRRIAVAAGMGAGIGAIFRAPLGGAVMAAEILYIHDLEVEALVPGLIASIVGYSIFGAIRGWEPIFGAQPGLGFGHALTLVYYALLGLICGAGGLLYAKSFYGLAGVFHKLRLPTWLKPALGAFLVGLIGLKVHGALGTGYGFVQIGMTRDVLNFPLWLILVLPFAKILATSLSIGSGGSGGIFGPGMVIGGMLGAAFWRLGNGVLPQMPHTPAPFVIIGMMALFGGIAHAPLAVMLMVAEMTGNLSLLAPAMVAVAVATALVGDHTIYKGQLPTRADAPAHRVRFSFPLLSTLTVRDAMSLVKRNGHVAETFEESERSIPLAPDQPLDTALEQLTESGVTTAPVIEDGIEIGRLSARDVVTTYKSSLQRSVRRANALTPDTVLFETRLGPRSPLVGKTLRDVRFPADALVVAIVRDGETIFPQANTKLTGGDVVRVLASRAGEQDVRAFLEEFDDISRNLNLAIERLLPQDDERALESETTLLAAVMMSDQETPNSNGGSNTG